jgi:ribosomal protein S18 acetylase RimI-like enzyme
MKITTNDDNNISGMTALRARLARRPQGDTRPRTSKLTGSRKRRGGAVQCQGLDSFPSVSLPKEAAASAVVCETHELSEAEAPEVLNFLSGRPLHTVAMTDLIHNCGLVSPALRGRFWGCRDASRELVGVALIGHSTLFETRTDAAIRAFALRAHQCLNLHLLMGEREKVSLFWNYYARGSERPRRSRLIKLLERDEPIHDTTPASGLRPATVAELPLVVSTQAEMVLEESGVNPLVADPIGFRARCLQRIHKGREWVLIKNGELIFKASVIAWTHDVAYVEGVYVPPSERRKGYAERCLALLTNLLLRQSRTVTLFVEETNTRAGRLYQRVGYRHASDHGILYI